MQKTGRSMWIHPSDPCFSSDEQPCTDGLMIYVELYVGKDGICEETMVSPASSAEIREIHVEKRINFIFFHGCPAPSQN